MEGSLLGESLGADCGYKKGASNGRLYGNGDGKLEEYPLGEKSFGPEARFEVSSSVRTSSCVLGVTALTMI